MIKEVIEDLNGNRPFNELYRLSKSDNQKTLDEYLNNYYK